MEGDFIKVFHQGTRDLKPKHKTWIRTVAQVPRTWSSTKLKEHLESETARKVDMVWIEKGAWQVKWQ